MPKQMIVIMVDTQRKDMLSCYDKDAYPTPNLDALASEGTMFQNAFTCQPVCGPARSALFTGLYPHSNGMWSNSMQLGEKTKNAAQWLKGSGVECAYIGKWHLDGGDYFGYGECPDGYNANYWYDMRNYLEEFPDKQRRRSRRHVTDPRAGIIQDKNTFAGRVTAKALDFINVHQDKDFFLTVSFDEPHDPCQCPPKYILDILKSGWKFHKTPNVEDDLSDKPDHHRVWAQPNQNLTFRMLQKSLFGLMACNRYADDKIGEIIRKVKAACPNAVIIYTADHGDMLLSHRLMNKGCAMYNEITNIPFIISGGPFEKEKISNTPVSHIDLLPTVLDYFGQKIPKMLQGNSLLQVDLNQSKRDVFIEYTRYEVDHDSFMGFQPIRSVFDGRYKLVINLMTQDELYDLQEDPYEMVNLIHHESYTAIRNELHDKLIDWMNNTRDAMRGYYWHCREWRPEIKPSVAHTGYTRQLEEEEFIQLDYSTGLPMEGATRKK